MARAIRREPVTLHGNWRKGRFWMWEGTAECAAEIAGISLIRVGGSTYWTRATRSRRQAVPITIKVFPYETEGEVEINVKVGEQDGICRHKTCIDDPEAAFQFELQPSTTGSISWFSHVEGNPMLNLGILLVCDEDVTTVRNKIWHLRKDLAAPDPIVATILASGRAGFIVPEGAASPTDMISKTYRNC